MNDAKESKVVYLRLDDIIPNRFQPREVFDENGLQELSDSIKEHGVIQPVIVRQLGDKYELIAGERRTKASALAGMTTIPAIIKDMDDKESAKVSLLENLQRKNLSAIEEARTYKRILELDNMTQEDLARTMGRSQPMVANKLRLLSLPEEVQEALMKNQISERHARSLLTLKDKKDQLMFLERIKQERLTVRELDAELKKFKEDQEDTDNSISVKEKNDERSFMNNNRGNFGGMGLNDYRSGVNNNMFNNIPNNFNNTSSNNENINYSNFDDVKEQSTNNNYFNENDQNNNINNNSNNSLGSMFDGYNNEPVNYVNDNNDNSNLFISHIREDNLPKVENQFLPNFDNFGESDNTSDGTREALNNFNQNNNYNDINMNDNYNNDFNMNNNMNVVNNQNMFNNNYNSTNNYDYQNNGVVNNRNDGYEQRNVQNNFLNMNGEFNPNSNINNNYEMNNSFNNYNQTDSNANLDNANMNNYFMGNDNYYANNQNSFINNNHNSNMTSANDNLNMNNQFNSVDNNRLNNQFNSEFNNNNMNQNMHQQNQGLMFEQPLNIVDVPRNNQIESNDNNNDYSVNHEVNINEKTDNINESDNYDSILFAKTTPIAPEENVEEPKKEVDMEDTQEIKMPVSDIEVIGDNDNIQEQVIDEQQTKENNDNYITLEPDDKINSTMDAVLEIKKTTDRIKRNNMDIETEEIDYDDVYQITIKIKKTDAL